MADPVLSKDQARQALVALARLILSWLPANEWQSVARDVAIELMRMSGSPKTGSGSYRIPDSSGDDE